MHVTFQFCRGISAFAAFIAFCVQNYYFCAFFLENHPSANSRKMSPVVSYPPIDHEMTARFPRSFVTWQLVGSIWILRLPLHSRSLFVPTCSYQCLSIDFVYGAVFSLSGGRQHSYTAGDCSYLSAE